MDSSHGDLHRIRLAGPWQAKVLARTSRDAEPRGEFAAPEAYRVHPPGDWSEWLGVDFRGVVQYERNFGRPTGLEQDQPVWLCIAAVDWRARVTLNDQSLGLIVRGDPTWRHNIRALLEPRNQLEIRVEFPDLDDATPESLAGRCGGLTGAVWLEM